MGLFGKKKPFSLKCRPLDQNALAAYAGNPVTGKQGQESRCTPHASFDDRIAVFGDVHANLEALKAVLADAKKAGVSGFICTGDLVGYGANPSECLEVVKALGCPVVKGNHDEYSATEMSLKDFSLHAMNALIWTREHLSADERRWLNQLPMQIDLATKDTETENRASCSVSSGEAGGVYFHLVHSSACEPEKWRYIIKPEDAEKVLPRQQPELAFFGHTHLPSWFAFNPDSDEFKSAVPVAENRLQLERGWKWLVNPGSIGQPRDGDPRAAYAVFDPNARTVEWRRVEYDVTKTVKKILKAGLPERNAQRLYKGR